MSAVTDKLSFFNPQATIQGIPPGVTIDERIHETMTFTRHPVQTGAAMTDHKFKNPTEIHIDAAWANPGMLDSLLIGSKGINDIYEDLLKLQTSSLLLSYIATNGRKYDSMQIRAVTKITDPRTYNVLALEIALEQIIVVKPASLPLPDGTQKNPQQTASTADNGKQSPVAAPNQSLLSKVLGPVVDFGKALIK